MKAAKKSSIMCQQLEGLWLSNRVKISDAVTRLMMT
jgi:hypothetical protein